MAAVDMLRPWCEQNAELVSHYEYDVPASPADAEADRERLVSEIFGDPYDGPVPTLVPAYVPRLVIPFALFLKAVSNLSKDR